MKKNPSLTIDVDEIPDAGWSIRGELPPEWLGDTLLDPYAPDSRVHVEAEAHRVGDNVHVRADVSFGATFACSRTLKPGRTRVEVSVHELFLPARKHDANLGDGVDGEGLDADVPYVYQNRTLDLEPLLREQIVLAQEPYPVVAEAPEPAENEPLWSSEGDDIDPRWAKLKDIDL
ncbi:MAG: YceD family protein [Myxococcota bacterium]